MKKEASSKITKTAIFAFCLIACLCLFSVDILGQTTHKPAPENLKNREWFQDAKFGLFVHWGVYSLLGNGEWVMNNTNIPIKQYEKLPRFFNPIDFDPVEWVNLIRQAGMKYITITSKHHDGFAMYNSRISDYDIVDRTPYGKDVLKSLAEECGKQGIKLFFYYSQLDWHHPDYYAGGRTGGNYTGRSATRNWPGYLDYMNSQIEELLTQYGPIGGIWFDGWWDKKDADWQLDRTYKLIHRLQPHCLVGNNHHVKPFPGEDFQMFEKDLPGKNTTGWAGEQTVSLLPLETCETMSGKGTWGFSIYDQKAKSSSELIRYLVRAAGHNSNFLLNVGPMPNGEIRPDNVDTLKEIGSWMKANGDSIYETRGGPLAPRHWGVTTQRGNRIFLHILDLDEEVLLLPPLKKKIRKVSFHLDGKPVQFSNHKLGLILTIPHSARQAIDTIIELELRD